MLSGDTPEQALPSLELPNDADAKLSTVILPTDWNESYELPDATTIIDHEKDNELEAS